VQAAADVIHGAEGASGLCRPMPGLLEIELSSACSS
jgi:hypothetical protein